MNNYPPVQINFKVDAITHKGLSKFAKDLGHSASGYAKILFDAAYSARCAPTGDKALDAAVAAVGAPQTGDAKLLAKIKEQAAAIEASAADRRALAAANTEVANLSDEIKRLKGVDKQLADAIAKLDKMAAENKALKAAQAPQAAMIEAAAADREATEIADRMLKEATDKLGVASTEVFNLSAELKRLATKAEADEREISTLTIILTGAVREKELLLQKLAAAKDPEPPPVTPTPTLRIVTPPTALGTFLATWVAEAGQVAA